MKTIYHSADSRGHANHGWLNTYHSFSFANYYNPERIQFGALRVLNDDTIGPGEGFGTHPHDNMEIITIPLSGDLEHKDSMGNSGVIRNGEIQVMSAGTGIQHSEFNHNKNEELKLLQIWVFPKIRNVEPRYDQISLPKKENDLIQIVSPNKDDDGVWIHQEAWFHLGNLKQGWNGEYQLKGNDHGVYAFVIEGKIKIGSHELHKRDALGISETETFSITAVEDSTLLLMEVPMSY
ncbi:MAG: pirin family protein [Bacteroidetes bacterium]|nr:pirin family protein [Bacteroidota bacterium]